MKKSARIAFMLAAIVVIAAIAVMTKGTPHRDVLVWAFRSDVTGECEFVLMNPLRDREPERVAEAFLREVKDSGLGQAMGLHKLEPLTEAVADQDARDQRAPVTDWTLEGRVETTDGTRIFFDLYRRPRHADPTWITLRRIGANWSVVRFETWYEGVSELRGGGRAASGRRGDVPPRSPRELEELSTKRATPR